MKSMFHRWWAGGTKAGDLLQKLFYDRFLETHYEAAQTFRPTLISLSPPTIPLTSIWA